MDINYELYKVFYYVGKTLSFSEASRLLFISQSAVSQSIKALEKKLDKPLFVRSTKKVILTKEGELLFKHIESAVNLIEKGENLVAESMGVNGGQLRIAASDTICRYYLLPFLKEFHKKYPQVHIQVKNGTSIQCVEYLASNKVDLIVTNYPNDTLSGVAKVVELIEFNDVFVANKESFKLERKKISYEELSKLPIMMLERNSTTSRFLHDEFLKRGIDLVPDIELSSNDLLIDMAKIGLGIAFVPDYCVVSMANELYEINLEERMQPRKLVAAYSGAIPMTEIAKSFLNILMEKIEK